MLPGTLCSRQRQLVRIVKQLQLAVPELVVRSTTVPEIVSKTISEPVSKTTAVDQLTKAFETFSVNLLQLAQPQQSFKQTDGFYRQYPNYGQQLLVHTDTDTDGLESTFEKGLS
jgi:hypothetical protein